MMEGTTAVNENEIQLQRESDKETEKELLELETEVKQMAKRIYEYRTTLPDQLRAALSSLISKRRPSLAVFDSASDAVPAEQFCSGEEAAFCKNASAAERETSECLEKVLYIKDKMASNVSAMPRVLERMRNCISNIDQLDSLGGSIHPVFKRRRPVFKRKRPS